MFTSIDGSNNGAEDCEVARERERHEGGDLGDHRDGQDCAADRQDREGHRLALLGARQSGHRARRLRQHARVDHRHAQLHSDDTRLEEGAARRTKGEECQVLECARGLTARVEGSLEREGGGSDEWSNSLVV